MLNYHSMMLDALAGLWKCCPHECWL